MDTLVVICQRQNVETLPKKVFSKIFDSNDKELADYFKNRYKTTDLTGFLKLVWKYYLTQKAKDSNFLKLTTKAVNLTKNQAHALLSLIFDLVFSKELEEIPNNLRKNLRNVVLRYVFYIR